MLEFERLRQDIQSLPDEAQQLLTDFVAFLKQRYQATSLEENHSTLNLDNSPFVGMWSDRPEMQDSTQWVKQIRQQHWS
ncbi:DUF2281 domain-containing protein [Sphaerothrix gracilis]|uniref:DUF2281 domain-containing protein n=1 Tax=Sphaerothrix gracilis TaxID=3151835 RepID=UPI0031FC9169